MLWVINQSNSETMLGRHPSSNIQLVMTFPFIDLQLNTSMFFAIPRCSLIALEPRSTKRCHSSLLNSHPTLQNSTFAGRMPLLVTDADHTVRGTSVNHVYHILRRGTKDGEICFSSSVYIANVRFGSTNRLAMHTPRKTHEDGQTYLKTCGPGNTTTTAQRTGVRKLGWFCAVGTFMYLGAHTFMNGREPDKS